MNLEEFENKFVIYLSELNLKLNEKQIRQFYMYMNLLLEWNKKINLTAITQEDEIILKHFVDSLTIVKYLKEGATVIDVGTGAGFPGIPIKIVREDVNVVLMDSLNKRLKFLDEVIKELELEKITTVHSRAEELARSKKYRESFDVATSRAVANLSTLAEYMLPFVNVGGQCICMKGSEVEEELEQAKNAISVLGGIINTINTFDLPKSDMGRNIIVIDKVRKTPEKYPRKPGTPAKEPIA